jgi:hypothetical protein
MFFWLLIFCHLTLCMCVAISCSAVPTQISFVWLNWIIIRFTILLPNQYLLQLNTFIFQILGWNCCRRMNSGGMNGPELPYRIYVDSGTVFLCIVGLGFASPLVAPAALCYYILAVPLLRRNSIFIYRPKYDGGGFRFPYLFDVFITSMCLGQVRTDRKHNITYPGCFLVTCRDEYLLTVPRLPFHR